MSNDILSTDELMHYGILRKSGRYKWGSGETPYQRNKSFLAYADELKKKGLTEAQIVEGLGLESTTQLRALRAIAKNANRAADISQAQRLKDRGNSNVAIGDIMGLNESSVRALLNPSNKERNDILVTTSNMLKDQLDKKPYLDIGSGVEAHLGIAPTKLSTAVAMLQEEGYVVHNIKVPGVGTGKDVTHKVLAKPDTEWAEVMKNKDQIGSITEYSDDGGRSYLGLKPPEMLDSKRVMVRYGEDGGAERDGTIELRPGVDDISMGGSRYAQVRIAVDGTHYLKGMAVYKDDMPDGVDVIFNTNKADKGNKLAAMKELKTNEDGSIDMDNPFGATIKPGGQRGKLNVINEEGDWNEWSKTLSSQMLSKQSHSLAQKQLDIAFRAKQEEFDEIMSLTNPVVKQHMLNKFADGADSSAVSLKAAALPRQRTQVILPFNEMKDGEIYAPNFRDGERVALVRYPHGGIFEIPELTVNNRVRSVKDSLGDATDAVGLNAKVAARLSGADFDGDTVLVIPNNSGAVKSAKPLEGLKGFDPQTSYPGYEGMKPMSPRAKQQQMGDVSNLITDMTIKGAVDSELTRAVRHSMVVIDAEKHKLNYKQSYSDNGIKELKQKYQARPDGTAGGASTLISRASSEVRVNERKERAAKDGGAVDISTGKRVYTETGAGYTNAKGKWVPRTTKTTKMYEADDAFSLSSGTPMEATYASHANKLKAMGNTARKQALSVKMTPYSPEAKRTYSTEVASLNAKLNLAFKNKPRERQAQLLANTVVDAKRKANPDMEADSLKKIKSQALREARMRTGADKADIKITPTEWQAIQSGAVSSNIQRQILQNTDLDHLKSLATPRTKLSVTPAKAARIRSMQASGHTQAEIADALGISVSTINSAMSGKD